MRNIYGVVYTYTVLYEKIDFLGMNIVNLNVQLYVKNTVQILQ